MRGKLKGFPFLLKLDFLQKKKLVTAPTNQAANNYIRDAARFVAANRYIHHNPR